MSVLSDRCPQTTKESSMTLHEPNTLRSRTSTILELPPSCLEFCSAFPDLFVVGMYYLEQNTNDRPGSLAQERRGGLLLFRLEESHLTLLCTLYTPSAILDLHFAPHEPTIAAVATSTGDLCFFRLVVSGPEPLLERVSQVRVFEPDILVLSFIWVPLSNPTDYSRIAVSLSNGNVAIIAFSINFQSHQILWQSNVHPLEAWTVAYSPATRECLPRFLYSGGDDSALCMGKLGRQDATISYDPVARDTKTHGAGVTAILPLPNTGNADGDLLLTGSYDEYLRVYDTVNRPHVLAEEKLGGGVWKLKLMSFPESREPCADGMGASPEASIAVLASCMHAGVRVLRVSRDAEGRWSIKILARFEEHESMNYASDVQPSSRTADGEVPDGFTCVSTSFYDRKLCVWKYGEGIEG